MTVVDLPKAVSMKGCLQGLTSLKEVRMPALISIDSTCLFEDCGSVDVVEIGDFDADSRELIGSSFMFTNGSPLAEVEGSVVGTYLYISECDVFLHSDTVIRINGDAVGFPGDEYEFNKELPQ